MLVRSKLLKSLTALGMPLVRTLMTDGMDFMHTDCLPRFYRWFMQIKIAPEADKAKLEGLALHILNTLDMITTHVNHASHISKDRIIRLCQQIVVASHR